MLIINDHSSRPRWADSKTLEKLYPGLMNKTRRYELLKAGAIKAKKVGRKTLFDTDSVEDFIASLPIYGQEA